MRDNDCPNHWHISVFEFYYRGYTKEYWKIVLQIYVQLSRHIVVEKRTDGYTIGDLLAHLWAIRMLMVAENNSEFIEKIDENITTKPPSMTKERWESVQSNIELRRKQFEDGLERRRHVSDSIEGLLVKLLRSAEEKNADQK